MPPVPSYVNAAFLPVLGSFALAVLLPAPRLSGERARRVCCLLVGVAVLAFTAAIGMIVLALFSSTAAYTVIPPAVAVICVALTLGLTMLWLIAAPRQEQADVDAGEDGEGGGGGGPPPVKDPPRDPGPPEGVSWDAFDRDRETWGVPAEPVRERELTSV